MESRVQPTATEGRPTQAPSEGARGLTARDHFAAAAMAGMLARPDIDDEPLPCPYITGTVTRYCTLTPFTLTDAEREAIAAGLGALERLYEDSPPISKPIYEQHAPTLRGLLERLK